MRIFFSMRVYGEGEYKRVNKSGYIRGCSTSKRDPLRASGILVCTHKSRTYAPSYIYPSLSVCVGKYIRFIGERDRAARKGHTLPTLQWYLKPLFPKGSFAFCCCAFRYRSILFPFFLSSFFFFLLLASHTRVSRRIHKNFYSEINRFGLLLSFLSSIRELETSYNNLILYIKLIPLRFLYTSWKFPSLIFFSKINNKLARWWHRMLHQKKETTGKKKKRNWTPLTRSEEIYSPRKSCNLILSDTSSSARYTIK